MENNSVEESDLGLGGDETELGRSGTEKTNGEDNSNFEGQMEMT